MSTFLALSTAILMAATPSAATGTSKPVALPTRARNHTADPLFAGAGRVSLSGATGVPFVGSTEIAYTPTEGFAAGALFVVTPMVVGVGLRPRGAVRLGDKTRLVLSVPVFYYPATTRNELGGGEPWFLSQPALRLERRFVSNARAYVGAGAIGAVGVMTREAAASYTGRASLQTAMPWGVWNTVNAGASLGFGERTTIFADVGLVMRGLKLAGAEWVGGPPLFVSVGIARTL